MPSPVNKIIDLEDHLNRTRSKHGDNGYNEWCTFRRIPRVTKEQLAELMKVNVKTVSKWIAIEENQI